MRDAEVKNGKRMLEDFAGVEELTTSDQGDWGPEMELKWLGKLPKFLFGCACWTLRYTWLVSAWASRSKEIAFLVRLCWGEFVRKWGISELVGGKRSCNTNTLKCWTLQHQKDSWRRKEIVWALPQTKSAPEKQIQSRAYFKIIMMNLETALLVVLKNILRACTLPYK